MLFTALILALPPPRHDHVLDSALAHLASKFDALLNPVGTCGTPSEPVSVSASRFADFGCGIGVSGQAHCWGDNELGRIDNTPNETTFLSISTGSSLSCGLKAADNKPMCWGVEGGKSYPKTPVNTTFAAISVGRDHACGLKPDGTADCWGNNEMLQTWPIPATPLSAIAPGGDHTCALKTDGTPICWGLDTYGQVSTAPIDTTLTSITTGVDHTCGLDSTGNAVCWGKDTNGQVSQAPTDTPLLAISAGANHTCGLKFDAAIPIKAASVICWGQAVLGGEEIIKSATNFVSISAGMNLNCAQKVDGEAVCWGNGNLQMVSSTPFFPFAFPCCGETAKLYNEIQCTATGKPYLQPPPASSRQED